MTREELAAEKSRLLRELEAVEAAMREINYVAAGIRPGDEVVYRGKRVRVSAVRFFGSISNPWVSGKFRMKNGEWSNKTINCYSDWTRE